MKAESVESRFWRRVRKTETCWLWTGARDIGGYGRMPYKPKEFKAHRVSWLIHYGEIPDGLCICHRCDVRSCVRPDHLFLGTHEDNTQDALTKGRMTVGSKHWSAKLTEAQVIEIRAARAIATVKEIAVRFNVTVDTIRDIINRRTWLHI